MARNESKIGDPNMPTRITVSLPDKEHAALTMLAQKYDVSLSWLTRKAVMEFLQRYGDGGTQPALDLPLDKKTGTG
ncbi:MAG: Ribbon-helix-helix protein, copG family [Rhodobacteraceae bacterium HLUCCA12]|nr:MAG: Ribbon-helix-helix protein, copG family [Rhodobacteraceae bacterium HLUCCA12]